MALKISEIAEKFNGKIENFKEDYIISSVSSIDRATEKDIIFLKDKKFLKNLEKSKAKVVLTSEKLDTDKTQIIVKNPEVVFYKLIDILYPDSQIKETFISETVKLGRNVKLGKNVVIKDYVVIEDNVEIGDNTVIYPFSFIGKNTKIGNNCIIYSNVSLYKDCEIGNNVIIHSGAVIGADGFGYYVEDGVRKKIKHIGKVIIKDNVEVGANTTIDRALLDETVIEEGTKIDNLVMVGHNCKIGKNTVLVSQVGIAGSCEVGNNVIMAGQVGVADHLKIADNVIITAKSGVGRNIEKSGIYGANIPAIEWKKWQRILLKIYRLADKKNKKE